MLQVTVVCFTESVRNRWTSACNAVGRMLITINIHLQLLLSEVDWKPYSEGRPPLSVWQRSKWEPKKKAFQLELQMGISPAKEKTELYTLELRETTFLQAIVKTDTEEQPTKTDSEEHKQIIHVWLKEAKIISLRWFIKEHKFRSTHLHPRSWVLCQH